MSSANKTIRRFVELVLFGSLLSSIPALAQDEPQPQPKPQPKPAASSKTKPAKVPPAYTVMVICDVDCNWSFDGEAKGLIRGGSSGKVGTGMGQHFIAVATPDGQDTVKRSVEVSKAGQTMVEIELGPVRQSRLEREAAAASFARKTWVDSSTGLMWTVHDNGSAVTWNQARAYCSTLRLEGYADWRLPSIEELAGIYDPSENVNGWHVKGKLWLSGGEWSSSPGKLSHQAWGFFFHDGTRGSDSVDVINYGGHALCVRRSGE